MLSWSASSSWWVALVLYKRQRCKIYPSIVCSVQRSYPCMIKFSTELVQIRQNLRSLLDNKVLGVENENRGSVLLCFLGVAQLKIVYKKANQQAVFCLYKYDSQILILSTDTLLYKSRAIASQRGLSLLYQQ